MLIPPLFSYNNYFIDNSIYLINISHLLEIPFFSFFHFSYPLEIIKFFSKKKIEKTPSNFSPIWSFLFFPFHLSLHSQATYELL